MIKHGMDIVKTSTEFRNPGQIPVLAMDQPLYALAKQIQWKWPQQYGEQSYVIMFGGLHMETTLWTMMGKLLEGCGWATVVTEAQIVSSGMADGLLKVTHLKRTRYLCFEDKYICWSL